MAEETGWLPLDGAWAAYTTANNVTVLMDRKMAERWAIWPATCYVAATARGKQVPICVRNIV